MTTITYEQLSNYQYTEDNEFQGQMVGCDVEIKTIDLRDETEDDRDAIQDYLISLAECENVGKVWVNEKKVETGYIKKC